MLFKIYATDLCSISPNIEDGFVRTFLECDEVKAVVSIGCCYNLLSEGGIENVASQCGFPMSKGVNDAGLLLGKSSRDLACQVCANCKTCLLS